MSFTPVPFILPPAGRSDSVLENTDRLAALLVRQRELLKRLDLDKDEVGSAGLGTEEARQAA